MSVPDNYAQDKQAFIDVVKERSAQLTQAAADNQIEAARDILQTVGDATSELLSYLESPVFDHAIESFYASPGERAKAAVDMNTYLVEAGLEVSPRAKWQMHDNNWCVDVGVFYHDSTGHLHYYGAHFNSATHPHFGWTTC